MTEARTDSSVMTKEEDAVDEAILANELSHGGQLTDEHQFSEPAPCTISTSTPDSECSKLSDKTKQRRIFEVCCTGVLILIICFVYSEYFLKTSEDEQIVCKVNISDVALIDQHLDRLTKWKEEAIMKDTKRIMLENLPRFLTSLKNRYRDSGMPSLEKLKSIFNLENGKSKTVEWIDNIINTESEGGLAVRFGSMAFKKSSDGSYVDCKLYIYKLYFTLLPNTVLTNDSILNGLYKLSNSGEVEIERGNTKNEITRFQNYIRHKALLEFQKEGFFDMNQQEEKYLN